MHATSEALQRIDSAETRMSTWVEELLDVAQGEVGRQPSLHLASVGWWPTHETDAGYPTTGRR